MRIKETAQILLIDDDNDIGEIVVATAQKLGLICTATTKVADFMSKLNPNIEIIMLDLIIPDLDGIELLRMLSQKQCKSKIILMSGVDKRILETAEDLALSLGLTVTGILQKPFRVTELEKIFMLNTQHNSASETIKNIDPHPTNLTTRKELEQAIERQEFVLYYQPQVEISTNRTIGVEALVRWQHPQRGLLQPDEFIGRAEELSLIDKLGWLVAEKALSEVRQLNQNGMVPSLSINVSPYSLYDLKFPDNLSIIVKQNNIEPENVILEITESGLLKELSSALDILTRLRMKKFRLSIDDFGTGYAMIQQLQHVPATELKIDKSLVQKIYLQDSAHVMIKKIIEMGHELGMQIIAEGIENVDQLEFLRVNNCDIAQGYFFSRPLPIHELSIWIKNRNGQNKPI